MTGHEITDEATKFWLPCNFLGADSKETSIASVGRKGVYPDAV